MKFAYLIIAHNEFEVLKWLVAALDDPDNDIFVHIDKKVKVLPELHTSKSGLFILDNRIDVRWGHVSQIEVEMLLFETALKGGDYDYFHLISGTHLPLKSNASINDFFEKNRGYEVMRLWEYDARDVANKMRTYHFLMRWYASSSAPIKSAVQCFWRCSLKAQRLLGIKRHKGTEFVKADNWMSLSSDAVRYLVDNKARILKKYDKTFCGDEYFVPTELSACGGRFKLKDCPHLLYVRFDCANAVALDLEDIERLDGSDYLFARKFSSSRPEVLEIMENR